MNGNITPDFLTKLEFDTHVWKFGKIKFQKGNLNFSDRIFQNFFQKAMLGYG